MHGCFLRCFLVLADIHAPLPPGRTIVSFWLFDIIILLVARAIRYYAQVGRRLGLYLTMDPRDDVRSSIGSDVSTHSGTDVDMPPMIAPTDPDHRMSRSRSNKLDYRPGEECREAQREYRCQVRRRATSAGGCQNVPKSLSV